MTAALTRPPSLFSESSSVGIAIALREVMEGSNRMRRSLALIFGVISVCSTAVSQSSALPTTAGNSVQVSQPESASSTKLRARELTIPAGTAVEIEAAYSVSSRDMRPGDLLSFRVLVPIRIDGVTLIDPYSLVTARVVQAKRGGHWGKAGKLAWMMQDVVAADLTRVVLTAQQNSPSGQNGISGTSHGGEVAAKTIVFGALLFPISPLALMSGFKRGEDAILPQGKRFVVYVANDTKVKVPTERN